MAVLQKPKQELTYLGASTPPGVPRRKYNLWERRTEKTNQQPAIKQPQSACVEETATINGLLWQKERK